MIDFESETRMLRSAGMATMFWLTSGCSRLSPIWRLTSFRRRASPNTWGTKYRVDGVPIQEPTARFQARSIDTVSENCATESPAR